MRHLNITLFVVGDGAGDRLAGCVCGCVTAVVRRASVERNTGEHGDKSREIEPVELNLEEEDA